MELSKSSPVIHRTRLKPFSRNTLPVAILGPCLDLVSQADIAMSDESGTQVLLYVYDLSNGFAAQMSMALLGKQVPSSTVPRQMHVTSPLLFPVWWYCPSHTPGCQPLHSVSSISTLCRSTVSGTHPLSWMARNISMEAEFSKPWLAPLHMANLSTSFIWGAPDSCLLSHLRAVVTAEHLRIRLYGAGSLPWSMGQAACLH